jgi:hypothetical protein
MRESETGGVPTASRPDNTDSRGKFQAKKKCPTAGGTVGPGHHAEPAPEGSRLGELRGAGCPKNMDGQRKFPAPKRKPTALTLQRRTVGRSPGSSWREGSGSPGDATPVRGRTRANGGSSARKKPVGSGLS